ncbi:MAG: hypothetical protein KUG79_06525 [Pseudomonadales bacterium]|nr:hypothetical protein [Pseudomonadales bacterium]
MKELIALPQFGFLSITGRDALKFLQGYTTCDLNDLTPNQSLPGAICNIKGRMIANFQLIALNDGFLLRLNRDLIDDVASFLGQYIVFSKATITDLSATRYCYGLMTAMDNVPQALYQITHNQITHDQITSDDEYTILCVADQRWEIWSSKEQPAAIDQSDWQAQEIASGYAWIDLHSKDEYLPQMFNLHNIGGISFDKGCYLGQEIIARMQYRGDLKKCLHLCQAERPLAAGVAAGDIIYNQQNKAIGKVISHQAGSFLAVIQTKSATDDHYLLADGTTIEATNLSQDQ